MALVREESRIMKPNEPLAVGACASIAQLEMASTRAGTQDSSHDWFDTMEDV